MPFKKGSSGNPAATRTSWKKGVSGNPSGRRKLICRNPAEFWLEVEIGAKDDCWP